MTPKACGPGGVAGAKEVFAEMGINAQTACKFFKNAGIYFVSAWLVMLALCVAPVQARADELAEAWTEMDVRLTELSVLTASLEEAQTSVDENQAALEKVAGEIAQSQEDLASIQKRLGTVAELMYKTDDVNILTIVTTSQNLDELFTRLAQLEAVAGQAAALAEEEKQTQGVLKAAYAEVNQRKDEATKAQADLERTKEALDASIADLETHIAELEEKAAAEAAAQAALEAARAAAAEAEAAATAAATVSNPQASTEEVGEGLAHDAGQEAVQEDASPAEQPTEEPAPAQTYESGDTSGWSTGIASAYGGSSDASTPNPGTTATGAVCDDYSMGVAVPLAWGPAPYYGRMVEISYNGMTVVATVNDCGGMGGGSRHLDLQPGVFKAFGFSTCQEWGLREVQYRFL